MSDVHASVHVATAEIIKLLQGKHKQPGEAIVRQVIVLRLLQAAGWDIWNPDAVMPEETNIGGKRPDFLIGNKPDAFALELKGMNVAFGQAEANQAVSYAGSVGVRWAVLTNGRVWVLLDEGLSGPFHEREVLRLELTLSDPEPFASDFTALLGASVWQSGTVEAALGTVRGSQDERQERERVIREKRPEVLVFQEKYEIGSFESAVALYAGQGNISEAEREILLGRDPQLAHDAVPKTPATSRHQPLLVPEVKATQWNRVVEFSYRVQQATATVRYNPQAGTWTVIAGSTALERHANNPEGTRLLERRQHMIERGDLERSEKGLVFLRDVIFDSPSAAAVAISDYPESGWDKWKDAEGRTAQHYRPSKRES